MVLTFNGSSGRLKAIHNSISKLSTNVDQNFFWWKSDTGGGAYVFNPIGTTPNEVTEGSIVTTTVIKVTKLQLTDFEFKI